MEQVLKWLVDNFQVIFNIISGSILVISYVVKLTPSQKDDTMLAYLIELLKKLSLYK